MTAHVLKGADGLNRRAFSADDIRRMTQAGILAETDQFELVEGELIEMAAEGFAHDRLKMALGRFFIRSLSDDFYVAVECTLELDKLTLVEPDLMICRDRAVTRSADGYLAVPPSEILLLIEVSVSSLPFDRVRKGALYARFGIEDYWIVDVNRRRTFVHREPVAGLYTDIREIAADAEVRPSALPLSQVAFRLDTFE